MTDKEFTEMLLTLGIKDKKDDKTLSREAYNKRILQAIISMAQEESESYE